MTITPVRDQLSEHALTHGLLARGELQRDWARLDTVPAIVEIVLTDRRLKEQ